MDLRMTLQVEFGGQAQRFTVGGKRNTVLGRHAENDLVLADKSVSRQQAMLTLLEGNQTGYIIQNLSQSSRIHFEYPPTLQPLGYQEVARLEAGYVLRVGGTRIQVVAIEEAQAQMAELQIVCAGCKRAVPAHLIDCPWCGMTLALGNTFSGT